MNNPSIQQIVVDLPNNFIRGRCASCPLSVKEDVYGTEFYVCAFKRGTECVAPIRKIEK